MINPNTDPKVEDLLKELKAKRQKLEQFSGDLEGLKDTVNAIFPKNSDHRNKYVLEEKLKTASSLYSTLLSYSMEINKSIISEINIRNKMKDKQQGDDDIDVRSIVEQLEKDGFKINKHDIEDSEPFEEQK